MCPGEEDAESKGLLTCDHQVEIMMEIMRCWIQVDEIIVLQGEELFHLKGGHTRATAALHRKESCGEKLSKVV